MLSAYCMCFAMHTRCDTPSDAHKHMVAIPTRCDAQYTEKRISKTASGGGEDKKLVGPKTNSVMPASSQG